MKLRKTERERTPLACDFRRPAENLVPHSIIRLEGGKIVGKKADTLKSRK
jgi:hypothetical protein